MFSTYYWNNKYGDRKSIDLVTKEYHERARIAKDVSAGSVLVTSTFALIIGIIIFMPKIITLLGGL